jgi:pyruvate/2-oxoglutarate dehydrogenase complex dihydrolipoamide dehydrogenase (E3) component
MNYDYDVAVIGAGTAGLVAASVADALGAKVALIEKDKVGGECLWRGCVPSKTLVRSAKVFELVKRSGEFGIHVEKSKLVWSALRLRMADVRDEIRKLEREQLAKSKITSLSGTASFVDAHTLQLESKSGTQTLTAKKFVLASGSAPVIPEVEGLREVGFLAPHDLFDRPNLPRTLIFIGGGPVACEMAQAFCRLGSKVTLIHAGEQLLPKEEADVADVLLRVMRNEGVEVHLNARVSRVEMDGESKRVFFQTSEGESSAKAGQIVVATGKSPDVTSLNLETAGVNFDKDGVKVDAHLRTSAKNIWACGDVLGNYYFTHVSEHEGKIAGANAVLPAPAARKIDYGPLVWVTFCDPEVAHLGLSSAEAKEKWGPIKTWDTQFKTLDRAIIEGETSGFARLITTPSGRLVGAHIIGPSAGELIGALIVPMREGALLQELADSMFPYPTLGEIFHRAGNEIYSETLKSPLVQKALDWLPK